MKRELPRLLIAAFLVLAPLTGLAESVSKIIAMPPGAGAFFLAVNPVTNKVYAANFSGVVEIDGATNATTLIPGTPFGFIAVNTVTNRIYASDGAGSSVTVIDGATRATVVIPVGTKPGRIAINESTNEAYVVTGTADVTVIDGATGTTQTVAVGANPAAIVVNPVANKAYVVGSNLTVIDGATKATTTLVLGATSGVAVNRVTNKVYVASQLNGITVVDGATNAMHGIPSTSGACLPVVDPSRNLIHITFNCMSFPGGGFATIDGASETVRPSSVTLPSVTGLVPNPAANSVYLYTPASGNMAVVDATTGTSRTFFVGFNNQNGPREAVFNPATGTLYASLQTVGSVVVIPVESRAVNLSTRASVLTGDNVMIGGFVIQGSTPKTVVVRARGPSLTGVNGTLADPVLQLYSGQTVIGSNDDWGTASNASALTASGFAPPDAKESALLVTLNPGGYTTIVSGSGGTTGIGLVEIFEVGHAEEPFVNIATRARVQTGDGLLIAGFVIEGARPQTVMVRARGPSLTLSGLTGVLANPNLRLFSGQTQIAANDDWVNASNFSAIESSGYAPGDPAESAILITLAPGAYSAVVTGADGGTGVAIVEVFKQ